MVKNGGIMTAVDADSGRILKEARAADASGRNVWRLLLSLGTARRPRGIMNIDGVSRTCGVRVVWESFLGSDDEEADMGRETKWGVNATERCVDANLSEW